MFHYHQDALASRVVMRIGWSERLVEESQKDLLRCIAIGNLLTIPNVIMGVATDQLNASEKEIQQLKQRKTNT